MDLRKAIAKIMDDVKGITQASIAREARIQRPQLNAFLRQGGMLPAGSLVRLAQVLLSRLDRVGEKEKDFGKEILVLTDFLSQQESGVRPPEIYITSASDIKAKKDGKRVKREDLGRLWPWLENILEIKMPAPKWYEDSVDIHVTGAEGSVVDISWSIENGLSLLVGERTLGAILVSLTKVAPGVLWALKPSDDNFSRIDLSEKF